MKNVQFLFGILLCFAVFQSCTNVNGEEAPDNNKENTEEAKTTDSGDKEEKTIDLSKVKLPDGFKIELYAEKVKNIRSLALSETGTLYGGTRSEGNVYAMRDEDGDHKVDKTYTLAKKLTMPNGVALKDGNLFVAEYNRVIRYDDIENNLENPPKPVVINDEYPKARHHGWKYIAFGPDGKLYVPVGAPCNICESQEKIYNSITRINPDGSGLEVVHEGVRNTVGFTWHPETKEIWFTDNGRDWMGDDMPACELNRASKDYQHFGYPYCHQGDTPDPEFGEKRACNEFVPPVQNLGPHTAPLGVEFIPAGNFPDAYTGHVLIAEHGSWNREKKIGYRLSLVKLDGNKAVSYEPFADGWLGSDEEVWGRPVDMEWMPDGSLLVSDDFAHAVYRISYQG